MLGSKYRATSDTSLSIIQNFREKIISWLHIIIEVKLNLQNINLTYGELYKVSSLAFLINDDVEDISKRKTLSSIPLE